MVKEYPEPVVQEYLRQNGVECSIHYPIPIHLQPAAKNFGYKEGSIPSVEHQAKRILSVPAHHYLINDDIEYMANLINSFYE